jgi:hypothetical protein
MKKITLIIAILALFAGVNKLKAQDSGFGAGIIIGEPTGISGKYWLSGNGSLNMAVAWSLSNDAFYIHADYARHAFKPIQVSKGQLPLYYGIGARMVFANDFNFGARIPLGINYIFEDAPLDVFAEIVPTLSLIPDTDFDLGGGIGVRFFFSR